MKDEDAVKLGHWSITFCLFCCALVSSCSVDTSRTPKPALEPAKPNAALPYKRIPSGKEDPGENGPDDSTELNAVKGETEMVPFSHFTHASNSKNGYGIPCRTCHHQTDEGEEPGEGCVDCHMLPEADAGVAHTGPDDSLLLFREEQKIAPVLFSHFTHASKDGYKIACDQCHHTGDNSACTDCHERFDEWEDDGKVVPKSWHAYHLQCKGCHKETLKAKPAAKAPIKCKGCHGERNVIPKEDELELDRALHLQCIGCHIKVNRASLTAKAPTRECGGCHGATPKADDAEDAPAKAEKSVKDTGVQDAGVQGKQPEPTGTVSESELEKNKGPAEMVIDHAKRKKPGVPFPHLAHQELGHPCKKCHHEGLSDPTCRSCHEDTKDAQKIYHKQCKPCHKENDLPTACNSCHSKDK